MTIDFAIDMKSDDEASRYCVLLRLNYMLYALCKSYHSNTEAVLFACNSSVWAITTGRLLDSKMGNIIKCLSNKDTTTRYRIGIQTKVPQPFD